MIASDIVDEFRNHIVGQGEGDARVLDLEVREVEDLDGFESVRVVLYLTPPGSGGWDALATRALKRQAREDIDRLLWERGEAPDGVTSVSVTAHVDSVDESDIAEDDAPEVGELTKDEIDEDRE